MALREVRIDGDPILRKTSREVSEITDRTRTLLDDMVETMYHEDGVGLAAPQVGILRRIIVVDDRDESGLLKMINPEIKEKNGSQLGPEGCLSVPNRSGIVDRPDQVKVEYLDEEGEKQSLEAEGFLARIICHEVDHLNGILYIDIMKEELELLEAEDGDI